MSRGLRLANPGFAGSLGGVSGPAQFSYSHGLLSPSGTTLAFTGVPAVVTPGERLLIVAATAAGAGIVDVAGYGDIQIGGVNYTPNVVGTNSAFVGAGAVAVFADLDGTINVAVPSGVSGHAATLIVVDNVKSKAQGVDRFQDTGTSSVASMTAIVSPGADGLVAVSAAVNQNGGGNPSRSGASDLTMVSEASGDLNTSEDTQLWASIFGGFEFVTDPQEILGTNPGTQGSAACFLAVGVN